MPSDSESNRKSSTFPGRWAMVAGVLLVFSAACVFGLWWIGTARPIRPATLSVRLTPPPKTAEDALTPISGAAGLVRAGGAYESFWVTYTVKRKYPAIDVIDEISSRLKKLGWRPLKDDWLNPGSPTSHVTGWTEFVDATPASAPQHVDQWRAQWENDDGEIVLYNFSYYSPTAGKPVRDPLGVTAGWYPATGRAEMQRFARTVRSKGWWRRWTDWLFDSLRF
jgi:hypothetical protein